MIMIRLMSTLTNFIMNENNITITMICTDNVNRRMGRFGQVIRR